MRKSWNLYRDTWFYLCSLRLEDEALVEGDLVLHLKDLFTLRRISKAPAEA